MKWAAAYWVQIVGIFFTFILSPAFAGLKICCALDWGLRPRLYASACFAGFELAFSAKLLRSTKGTNASAETFVLFCAFLRQ
jgi:hypothetical protein